MNSKPTQKHPRPFLLYSRGGAPLRPPLPHPQTRKSTPRTLGGPAMQAPTSKRQGLRKKISLFQNFIVGASIARPLKPCAAARPLGWSRAPPLPCTARECVKFLSHFRNFAVGAGPRSARPCRACKPENPPPAPLAGLRCRPLQAKGKACVKNISLSCDFIVGASIARPLKPCAAARPLG